MEGPTPVSALLHSATLVIAGVIIYSRSSSSYQASTLSSLILVGTLLVLLSFTHDADSKKCAAISTCIMISLLWIELLSSSTGSWTLAITHANYKSTLFVLLAYVLTTSGSQDVRNYVWSFSNTANLIVLCVLVYSLSIAGTHYAYAKLGTKLLCHSPASITRASVSIVYLITSVALYIL
jgi:NADH-quinone oxidoreductase subunit L